MAHSVSEYLALKGEDETAIVSNLLPFSGALNIFGLPKVGKSYLALQLADVIGNPAATEFMGFPVRVHGEVLYLQVDTPRNLWIDRVAELMAKGLVFENVYFADRQDCPEVTFDILNPAHHQWLVSECQARPYLTVIIDTLRETFDGDENDSNQMKRVVAKLVKATAPAALVLISHSRKPSRDQPSGITQNQRGSSYVAGRMDALVEVIEGKLNARSRTMGDTTITVSQGEDCGMFACVESTSGGEGAAQEVVSAFPTLSGREQAKLLQDKLGGKKGIEACRSLLRRIKEKS
jgi:RecA-family ATPase